MSEHKAAQETLEKMQRIIAAEPNLVQDAAALARRIRAEAGVISDVAVLDLLRRLRQDATGMGPLDAVLGREGVTTLPQLVDNGTLPEDIAALLRAVVDKRISFLVIGGTGSGKTTLLSALLGTVSERERILVIEDTAELSPHHPHCVSVVSRRANAEGSGEVTMSQLLRQALRMRPDRIVVGEIRGREVVDLLAALNTGHDGGAGTLHANSLFEVPARMEALAALGGLDRAALHSQLAAAVHMVLTMERTPQGRRLAHIGLLEGNPVTPRIIWSAEDGPAEGFAEFSAQLLGEHAGEVSHA